MDANVLTYTSLFLQRLHKILQMRGFDVIELVTANVVDLCKVKTHY